MNESSLKRIAVLTTTTRWVSSPRVPTTWEAVRSASQLPPPRPVAAYPPGLQGSQIHFEGRVALSKNGCRMRRAAARDLCQGHEETGDSPQSNLAPHRLPGPARTWTLLSILGERPRASSGASMFPFCTMERGVALLVPGWAREGWGRRHPAINPRRSRPWWVGLPCTCCGTPAHNPVFQALFSSA